MCDCPEIQGQRPVGNLYLEGDYAARKNHANEWYITLCVPNYKGKNRSIYFKSKDSIWLPRQDQLQEMVAHSSRNWLLRELSDFGFDWDSRFGPILVFGSIEQLTLAFVLKEKYQKICNGDKWV